MSTDDTVDEAAADARDERLARALAVPPLDDVARGRLIRGAIEYEAPPTRRPRLVAVASVAAALAVGAVIGVVLVRQPDETQTTTVQRAPSGSQGVAPSSNRGASAVPASQPALANAGGPITPLGDLGDVTDPNRLRLQLQRGFAKSPGPQDQATLSTVPCIATPPRSVDLVAVSAVGTGTYRANPVTVLVGTSPEGHALAVVVRPPDCQLVASVPLPSN